MRTVQARSVQFFVNRNASPAVDRRARRATQILLKHGRSKAVRHGTDYVVVAAYIGHTFHLAAYWPSKTK